jgi:hypothetical protein
MSVDAVTASQDFVAANVFYDRCYITYVIVEDDSFVLLNEDTLNIKVLYFNSTLDGSYTVTLKAFITDYPDT